MPKLGRFSKLQWAGCERGFAMARISPLIDERKGKDTQVLPRSRGSLVGRICEGTPPLGRWFRSVKQVHGSRELGFVEVGETEAKGFRLAHGVQCEVKAGKK